MCLTDEQIKRQDFVDNLIFELIKDLGPDEFDYKWDINLISKVRDCVEEILVNDLKCLGFKMLKRTKTLGSGCSYF